jgi:hypothetical protein
VDESANEFIARKSAEWDEDRRQGKRLKTDQGQGSVEWWSREAWTFLPQSNYPGKVLVIERWQHIGLQGRKVHDGTAMPGDIQYRFGYWAIARTGRAAGRWQWQRFAMLIPAADLSRLLAKARTEGTLLGLLPTA